MRRLDRYLARAFTGPFLVALATLLGLFIVSEILTHLQRFIQYGSGFWSTTGKILIIYLYRTPHFLSLVAPMTMALGAAFGLSELSKHNELMAMRASGVSALRALAPIFVTAAVFSALLWANREYVEPVTENKAMPMFVRAVDPKGHYDERLGVVNEDVSVMEQLPEPGQKPGKRGSLWRLEGARPAFHGGYGFVRQTLKNLWIALDLPGARRALIFAKRATYKRGGWVLENVKVGKDLEFKRAFWRTKLAPSDLIYERVKLSSRPWSELQRYVRDFPGRPEYRVILYRRLTYPLTGIILMMLSLPLTLRAETVLSKRLLSIGAAVAICLAYYGVEFLAHHLGDNGQLPPAVAVFAPVVLGAAVGCYLMDSLRT